MSGVFVRIQYATGQVEQRALGLGSHTVGRETGDIVLHDGNVSGSHARIDVDLGRVVITDLGSSNGTLDPTGQRISSPTPLLVGMPIRLGGCSITLVGPVGTGGALFTPPAPTAGAPPGGYPPPPGYGQGPSHPQAGYGAPPPQYPPPGGYGAPGGYVPPGAFPPAYVPPGTPTVEMDYANWAPRAVGHVIDQGLVSLAMGILIGISFAISTAVTGAAAATGSSAARDVFSMTMCCILAGTFPIASLGIGIWNRVYLVSKRGYSIGQGVMKLKVVDHNGQLLTFGNAFLRLLAQVGLHMVAFGGILDSLWPLWDQRKQTLHDKAVNCYVINRP